jgi:selenocysteine lyase/cysteine desulfurase
MLESQRDQFEVPPEICYLNAAAWSPLPKAVVAAGHAGVERKARPWELPSDLIQGQLGRARRAAAALIGAEAADIALIPSVSYGVASAGKFLKPASGSRVLVLEDDHVSPVLEWMERAKSGGYTVEKVRRAQGAGWTEALLDAIARPGAAPVGLVSISSVHWSDGGVVDLAAVAAAGRAAGAMLLVDATHHAGALPLDVVALDPDVLIFPTYKWALGPYGRAFLYVAKRHQQGVPLEQTGFGRVGISSETSPYMRDLSYRPDASRFDMGERDHFISLEMAAVGMEYLASLGVAKVAQRLAALTDGLAARVADLPVAHLPKALRAPNLLCLEFPGGMPAGLIERLAAKHVYVAPRVGRMRISPHVYNNEADLDRFANVLRAELAALAKAA